MMFEKIVGFGDSFMWGDELLDPDLKNHPRAHPILVENTAYRESHCFLGLLGQHFNVPVQNFGIAGGSLQSTIWTYLWWLENETVELDKCLVLVALTDANRQTFYNPRHVKYSNDPPWNKFKHTSWINQDLDNLGQEWSTMIKQYMVLTNCAELCQLNYRQAVLFFQGQADKHQALLQFNSIVPCITMNQPSLLWPDTSLQQQLKQQPCLMAPLGHPNEQGHVWIQNQLINSINCVILDK